MKNNKNIIIFLIISVIINITFIVFLFILPKTPRDYQNLPHIDTTYNKIIIDSIEYNIIKKDSIIKKYRYESIKEIKNIDSISIDSNLMLLQKLLAD